MNNRTTEILKSMPVGIAMFEGPEHRYTFVNDHHAVFFGGRTDFIGKTLKEALPKSDPAELIRIMDQVYLTGVPFFSEEFHFPLLQESGRMRTLYFNIAFQALRDEQGAIYGVMDTAVDVTEMVESRNALAQKNTELSEAYRRLSLATEVAKVGFFDWNMNEDVIVVSERFQRDWGVGTGSPIEKMLNLILPEDREPTRRLIEHAVKSGDHFHAQYRIQRKTDGKTVWIDAQGQVSSDAEGKPHQFFGTSIDISEQKSIERRLSAERKLLDQIFERSPAGMAVWVGESLRFDRVNPDYQKLFGDRQLVGLDLLEACPELKGQGFDHLLREVMRTGEPFTAVETPADIAPQLGMKPETRFYNFSYLPVFDEDGNAFAVYDHSVDVTDAVLAKKSLDEARQAAESASLAKSQFLTNMSHEIRTPLGAIMGFADFLRSPSTTPEEAKKYIEVIERNSHHLLRLVDDILDLSKVEAGKLVVEKIDFSLIELITEFAALMSLKAHEKGIEFAIEYETQIPSQISSDPTRIRQILNNLVSNAIKFTSKGGVQLCIGYRNEELKLSVVDSGIGIASEQVANLFVPFQQADSSTTRKFGGTGLGLVLTRRLCQAMDGSFDLLRSSLDSGSTFVAKIRAGHPISATLIKPVKTQSFVTSQTGSETGKRALENLKILVVEDSPDNQVLIRLMLTKQGADVTIASDGSEGVAMATQNEYHVVLCDMQMPKMDGYETVGALRGRGYDRPIIALTAHAMKQEYAKAMAAGFSDYLTKPILKGELIAAIVRHAKV